MSNYCAIFDLDETLIKQKSMIEIIRYYYLLTSINNWFARYRFESFKKSLVRFNQKNCDRVALNRFFYKQLANMSVNKMKKASAAWFSDNKNNLFNFSVLEQLKKHQEAGAEIIIVTGSFLEGITPILDELGIKHVICAKLHSRLGRYTGELETEPTIGEYKKKALHDYAAKHGLHLSNSFAYGDHDSDLYMLSAATFPVVVGDNTVLVSHAKNNGWLLLN